MHFIFHPSVLKCSTCLVPSQPPHDHTYLCQSASLCANLADKTFAMILQRDDSCCRPVLPLKWATMCSQRQHRKWLCAARTNNYHPICIEDSVNIPGTHQKRNMLQQKAVGGFFFFFESFSWTPKSYCCSHKTFNKLL